MKSLTNFLLLSVIATGLEAATILDQSATVVRSQVSLSTTAIGGGLIQWTTVNRWTNNGATALDGLYFLYVGQSVSVDGGNTFSIMQWDDPNARWVLGAPAVTATPVNFAFPVLLSDTNVSIPAGRGLTPASSVMAYSIGSLAPGAFVDVAITRNITDNVNFITSTLLTPVTVVPEPASWALLAGGLALGLRARALRQRRQ